MQSVFRSRHLPIEELYYRISDPGEQAVLFAISSGGAEMAYPTAYLLGVELRLLGLDCDLEQVPDVEGRVVWIFDDGEARDVVLAMISRGMRASGAAEVNVASGVLTRRFKRLAGPRVVNRVVALRWREAVSPAAPIYAGPSPWPVESWLADANRWMLDEHEG